MITSHVFRTRLNPRFGRAPSTCPCAVKVVATPPWTLARGFSGLSAPGRPLLGPPVPTPCAKDVDGAGISPSPVTRRRATGRSGSAELGSVALTSGALPSAARRARSWRVCTARKCARSSGHFISSRLSFDRVATVTTGLLKEGHQGTRSAQSRKVRMRTVWELCAGIRQSSPRSAGFEGK
jgi:hypothetical protein